MRECRECEEQCEEQFGQGLCDATLVPGRSWGDPRARDGSHQPTKRDCARLCASYSACRAWTFNTQVTHLTTVLEIFITKNLTYLVNVMKIVLTIHTLASSKRIVPPVACCS